MPHHNGGHGVAQRPGEGGRGELRRRRGDVDGVNSALPLLPRRGDDGEGVAGALLLLRRRGGGEHGVDGALLLLPWRGRRAPFAASGAAATVTL